MEKIILGIDPGTNVMGFGIISVVGSKLSLIHMDELIMKSAEPHELKLKKIFDKTLELIDTFLPDEMSIEEPFFGKNVQSMIKLGRAQGVAMAAGLLRNLPIAEYYPKKVKMAITGSGNASKEQVAEMLKTLLNLKEFPTKYLDASDGLALAVCHYLNSNKTIESNNLATKSKKVTTSTKGKSYSSWESFVDQNKERVDKKK